jgi:hypothetical protein
MFSTIPSLQPLYTWQNSGEFLNYGQWKLGPKWAVGSYHLRSGCTGVRETGAPAVRVDSDHLTAPHA